MIGFANPTLKRGANNHCAYGAGNGLLPAQDDRVFIRVKTSPV
jgi:hypothetical protein